MMAHGDHSPIARLLDRPLDAEALAFNARVVATPPEPPAGAAFAALLFRMGSETLAISAASLRRITPYATPIAVPHRSNELLRGVCNIVGELVLCVDLRTLLGLPPSAPDDGVAPTDGHADPRRMIVIGPPEASWVFDVDAIVGIERIDPAALAPPPVTVRYALEAFVEGVATVSGAAASGAASDSASDEGATGDGTTVTLLDATRLLEGLRRSTA